MSTLEDVCKQEGCIQCWAEDALGAPIAAIRAEITESLRRSGVRETRLTARHILLESHECGKTRDCDYRPCAMTSEPCSKPRRCTLHPVPMSMDADGNITLT